MQARRSPSRHAVGAAAASVPSGRARWRGAVAARPWPRSPCRCPPALDLVGGGARRAPAGRPVLLPRAARPRRLRAGAASARPLWSRRAGPSRFARRARRVRELGARTLADDPARDPATRRRPPGRSSWAASRSRPTAARRPSGRRSRPAQLVLPELSLARHGGRGAPDRRVAAHGDDDRRTRCSSASPRAWRELAPAPMPLLDPDPRRARARGGRRAAAPLRGGGRARGRADRARGELEKVVLAREVRVHGAAEHRPGAGVRRRSARPSRPATATASARPELAFVGRQPGAAGAPRRRRARRPWRWRAPRAAAPTRRWTTTSASSCCSSPKDREEQAIVARRIERTLDAGQPVGGGGRRARAGEGAERPAPGARRSARSSREPLPLVELAGLLHPTPGGRRRAADGGRAADPGARGPRPRLVRRRRSAGPTWPRTASSASRCAARCCAGAWRTSTRATASSRDSVPAEELAETEVKLQALLPLLT